ncbi:MAG: phosphoribosyltransferase family protein [Candidatus Uhrbacteria bacterium]|nr:phosphoribosyltransferase family protein [Candidatus Uhrbacteria bacterium]
MPYGNPIVRGVIGYWKYDGDRSVERTLKQWIEQSRGRLRPVFEEFVVTHVPIHSSRKRLRGFDQAEVLSNWVGEIFDAPIEMLLVRSRKTKPQAKTHHDKRRVGSLDGIFEIHPQVIELPARVLLCDDVFTSGATMDAAAKCLKDAGVEEVWGFVMAKGSHEA